MQHYTALCSVSNSTVVFSINAWSNEPAGHNP
jgi:hypothetical protein